MIKWFLIILIIPFYTYAECSVYLRNVTYLSGDGYRKMNIAFADSIRKTVTNGQNMKWMIMFVMN